MKVPDTFEGLQHQFAVGEANEKALEKLDKIVGKGSALANEKQQAVDKAVAQVKSEHTRSWLLDILDNKGFQRVVTWTGVCILGFCVAKYFRKN